jgi:hypothetical protein
MTPPPTQTPADPLDPATLAGIQSATINAVPPRPGASDADKAAQREGALAFLAALRPGDPVQAMLAVHIIASHYAAMEYFRRAARDDLSIDLHLRVMGKAVALCRMIERGMRDLAWRQGIPALRPAARPASVPAARAQPAPEAAGASTPPQAPVAESRHARRRRERAERHLAAAARAPARHPAAAAALPAGVVPVGPDQALHQRLLAEVAARAGSATTLAA